MWTLTQLGEEFCEDWLADTQSVIRTRKIDELLEDQIFGNESRTGDAISAVEPKLTAINF